MEDQHLKVQALTSILNKDKTLFDHLPKEEMSLDMLHDVDNALGKRLVDDSPKKIELQTQGIPNDFCESLRVRYDSNIVDEEEVSGRVVIAGYTFGVDIELKRIIVALLEIGITPDQKLSIAVNNVFHTILSELTKGSYMTTSQFCKAISKVKGDYEKLLVKTMLDILGKK